MSQNFAADSESPKSYKAPNKKLLVGVSVVVLACVVAGGVFMFTHRPQSRVDPNKSVVVSPTKSDPVVTEGNKKYEESKQAAQVTKGPEKGQYTHVTDDPKAYQAKQRRDYGDAEDSLTEVLAGHTWKSKAGTIKFTGNSYSFDDKTSDYSLFNASAAPTGAVVTITNDKGDAYLMTVTITRSGEETKYALSCPLFGNQTFDAE